MGVGKTWYSLVMGSGSFWTNCQGGFWLFMDQLIGGGDGGGLSTALSPGLRSGGLESKFGRGPGPRDRRVVGWSCLCLGYKQVCVFEVPSWGHWFANRRCSYTTCLRFSIVIRIGRWKMEKGKLIAYHLLESSTGAYIKWLVNELMHC